MNERRSARGGTTTETGRTQNCMAHGLARPAAVPVDAGWVSGQVQSRTPPIRPIWRSLDISSRSARPAAWRRQRRPPALSRGICENDRARGCHGACQPVAAEFVRLAGLAATAQDLDRNAGNGRPQKLDAAMREWRDGCSPASRCARNAERERRSRFRTRNRSRFW